MEGRIGDFRYEWILTYAQEGFAHEEKLYKQAQKRDRVSTNEAVDNIGRVLEDFSLRVIALNVTDDERLFSIRKTFVDIVERCSIYILLGRAMSNNNYHGISQLYIAWRDKDDRTPLEEKINQRVEEWTKGLNKEDGGRLLKFSYRNKKKSPSEEN